jgi:hypothetical protein
MSVPAKPSRDVDALARRLPRQAPNPERLPAKRRALLDAARPQPRWWRGGPARTWGIGLGAVAAAAACALIAWHTPGHQAVAPGQSPAATTRVATDNPRTTAGHPAPVAPASVASVAVAPVSDAAASNAAIQLPEGLTSFDASHSLQLTRGGATITAPPGARFDVDVQGDQVKRVSVKVGWVVIASSHAAATMVVERQQWTPPPPPAVPTPASPDRAPAMPRLPGPGSSAGAPARPSSPRAASSTASPGRAASELPPASPPEPAAIPARRPASPASPAAPAAEEQDFHDGLRMLLAGEARAAVAPLDRACRISSSTQDDICYWAAVASQRSGDTVRARDGFGDVLARWPHSTHAGEANVALGWLLLDHGDRAGARARFAAAADDRMPTIRAEALRGLAAAR